jgi:integrase
MTGRRRDKRAVAPDGTVTVHGKNANGEGSVFQTRDGRWVATWWEPGRRYPRKATGKSRDDAIRRRDERRAQPPPGRGQTLGEVADWWLHNVYRTRVSIDTWHKAEERLPRVKREFGHLHPSQVTYDAVVEWLATLLEEFKRGTVKNYRQTLALIFDDAVRRGLAQGNPVRTTELPTRAASEGRALDAKESRALVAAAQDLRLGAAVVLLYLMGWRVSEVLGLAWDDIDFEFGKVTLRRSSVYRKGVGRILKPTAKTDGAHGEHWLTPTCLELLKARRAAQLEERAAADRWETVACEGRPVDLVFTNLTGGLVQRYRVQRAVERAAKAVGIDPSGLATHGGRRTVITVLWSEGDESVEDIAELVGHVDPKTIAGYVKRRGKRPERIARRSAQLLDPAASQ